MKRGLPITILRGLLLAALLAWAGGCGSDKGSGPTGFGFIHGEVRLPFKFAAADEPVAGAVVRVTAAGLDTSTVTDENGAFMLGPVPATAVDLSASFGTCLSDTRSSFSVPADDTVNVILTLVSHAAFDTIALASSGADVMEIDPGAGKVLLLYDAVAHGGIPALTAIDLSTGETVTAEFTDLTDVFDLKVIHPDLVVFNFLSANGYGLRFYNPVSMSANGEDVIYFGRQSIHAGRLALDSGHDFVFVTHGLRDGTNVFGSVYAVSVAQRQLIDADRNPFDLQFAFDGDLVSGSIGWAYNIAFDSATNEILVGNRQDKFVTAIDWTKWGDFDRDAGLSLPTEGVRTIAMNPPGTGFGVVFWDFAGGMGIAAAPLSPAPILSYRSGSETSDQLLLEDRFPASTNHVLKVVPQRQSWFMLFDDPDRSFQNASQAIEERSLSDLTRIYRFESRFVENANPSAFAVDADAGILYVAYRNRPIMELFCLP